MKRLATAIGLLATAHAGSAHHSTAAIYDGSRTIEITGIVESVSWRNPHGEIVLNVGGDDGASARWRVETPAVVVLRILGIGQDFIAEGDRISIAGSPARRGRHAMTGRHILLASGYELAFGNNTPWFPAGRNGNLIGRSFDDSDVDEAIAKANGIFRVWATNMTDPAAFPMFKGGYPLTTAAEDVVAQWNPLDNDLLHCGTKGQPLIMITPAPIEFVDEGAIIRLRIEEYDSQRLIHMDPDAAAPDAHTQFGFSRGHWDGTTLVVETDHIRAQYFDPDGVPQSAQIRTTERFMPNAAWDRMDYTLTVEDPVYFAEPFTLSRYFVWKPEMTVHPYECLERDWTP